MAKTVTIAGSRFPAEVKPGERVTFQDDRIGTERTGTVLDRAPNGPAQDCPANARYPWEGSGVWLWVIPDTREEHDASFAVRVRYYSRGRYQGTADADYGPMIVRTASGARWAA